MSNASNQRKFEVSVLVDSEHRGRGELAALLMLSPDEGWEKGESYSSQGQTPNFRKGSRWAVVERDGDIEDWGTTVDRLIARLRPIEAAFRCLPPDVYVRLMVCITEDNGVFGFGLDKRQVAFMASIGAELDMSFVVWSEPPPPKSSPDPQ